MACWPCLTGKDGVTQRLLTNEPREPARNRAKSRRTRAKSRPAPGEQAGQQMITAVMALPELTGIELFVAGVEPAEAGSVGCVRKAGLQPLHPEPDWEGVVYYGRHSRHVDRAR